MVIFSQGFKPQALAVTLDPEHKFELAVQLGEMKTAFELAKEADVSKTWQQPQARLVAMVINTSWQSSTRAVLQVTMAKPGGA